MSEFCGSKTEAKLYFQVILFLGKMLHSCILREEHPGKGRNKLLAQRMASTPATNEEKNDKFKCSFLYKPQCFIFFQTIHYIKFKEQEAKYISIFSVPGR